ncbi:MAG TPA: Asp23/Gls24 family envelope stress response protein [Desulfotomaculum sp.]|nr:Asp23/Gls24 family envelope stress response protein [Desulfotomaculum sp.]
MEEVNTGILQNNKKTVPHGAVKIADEVVKIIAGIAASEVTGVAGMSGGIVGGIAERLGRKNLSKGIKAEVGEKETAVEVSIIVDYGVRIPEVAFQIQQKVKEVIQNMTGLKVKGVTINVQGVNLGEKEEKEEV